MLYIIANMSGPNPPALQGSFESVSGRIIRRTQSGIIIHQAFCSVGGHSSSAGCFVAPEENPLQQKVYDRTNTNFSLKMLENQNTRYSNGAGKGLVESINWRRYIATYIAALLTIRSKSYLSLFLSVIPFNIIQSSILLFYCSPHSGWDLNCRPLYLSNYWLNSLLPHSMFLVSHEEERVFWYVCIRTDKQMHRDEALAQDVSWASSRGIRPITLQSQVRASLYHTWHAGWET